MPEVTASQEQRAGYKYWAFISYSHRDKKWADWLHRSIETFKVPANIIGRASRDGEVPARLFPVFRDREELPTSADLGASIQAALSGSRYLIAICSPNAAASRWVGEEIRSYKAMGREGRILCLIVDGEPNASDKPESGLKECFPEAVRFKVGSDGRLTEERTEPIAADVRTEGDGRANALLKVLAGLLGVGFDELRQRDLERRQRQRLVTAAGTFAVLAALVGSWSWQERSKGLEVTRRLAFSYAIRAKQSSEAGDDAKAAILYAEANRLYPSHLARAAALLHLRELPLPKAVLPYRWGVRAVAMSPDGRRVLVTSREKGADLWDLSGAGPLRRRLDSESEVRVVAFSPDGRLALTGGMEDGKDALVRLWDPATGEQRRELVHPAEPTAVRFSPDGARLLSAASDRVVRLWDISAGARVGTLQVPCDAPPAFAYSPDGSRIALGGCDSGLLLLSTSTLQRQAEAGPAWTDSAVVWGSDGRSVARLSNAGAVWVGRPEAAEPSGAVIAGGRATAIAFSPDGSRLWTASEDGSFSPWDPATGSSAGPALQNPARVAAAAFLPKGVVALLAGEDGATRPWDVLGRRPAGPPFRHSGSVNWVLVSGDGGTILTAGEDGTVRLWQPPAGRAAWVGGPRSLRPDERVGSLSFVARGTRLFGAGGSGPARLWDVATGSETILSPRQAVAGEASPDGALVALADAAGTVSLFDAGQGSAIGGPWRTGAGVRLLAFSPDGRWLAAGGTDGNARLKGLSATTGLSGPEWVLRHASSDTVTAVAVSRDASWVAIGGADGAVLLFRRLEGGAVEAVASIKAHKGLISALAFDPSESRLLSASWDSTARLWDLGRCRAASGGLSVAASCESRGPLLRHDGDISLASFDPSGSRVATADWDGVAALWDAATGRRLGATMRHGKGIAALEFSPDGLSVVTGSRDGTWRLWDAQTGEPLLRPLPAGGPVMDAAFSADGRSAVVGGTGVAVLSVAELIRDISPAKLSAVALAAAGLRVDESGDPVALSAEELAAAGAAARAQGAK